MIEKIVQIVFNKQNFKLSTEVPLSYVVQTGIEYSLGLVRGFFRKPLLNRVGSKLVIGHGVKLRVKSKMSFGDNVRIGHNTFIDALSTKGLYLGNGVKIGSNSKILITGTVSDLGEGLWIGENTNFSENTFFGAAGGIHIGKDVIAGQNVRFHAENHNYSNPNIPIRLQGVNRKGIEVGNNVWIGAGVVFLDGAKVGNNSIVTANAIVNKKFPDNVIVGGVPAVIIKKMIEEEN